MKIDLMLEHHDQVVTKRTLLSSLAAIYDPLGVSGPIILKARVLFQKLCAKGLDWDEELTNEDQRTFEMWMADLKEMKQLSFPRFIGPRAGEEKCSIHVFCDASSMGYCAAVYLVVQQGEEDCRANLLTAKCRLAPLKKQSIPRLELLSARAGAKLANTVLKDLEKWRISNVYFWLDSMTALYWIANKHDQSWWQGPDFLLGQQGWPQQPKEFQPSEDARVEEKEPSLMTNEKDKSDLSAIIDVNRFSSLNKLLRCTARVFRFVANCKSKSNRTTQPALSVDELQKAKIAWITAAQTECKFEKNYEDKARDLGLQENEDGLLRCHGRLQNANLSFDERFPILLPTKSRLTSLIIEECHERIGHGGVSRTLAEIRGQYWVVRGRQAVKSVIKSCRGCKVFSAKSLNAVKAAQLPRIRAARTRPFQHTGVDFAGPLYVKQGSETKKAYITLFSCATTRAVHLELAPDMTAETFIMSLEKFFAAWGIPNLILSDNAATFKSAATRLRDLKEHPEIQSYMLSNYLTWKFNLSLAPWWGGHYERLVGMTKTVLKRILGKAALKYSEMEVVLKKTQGILNNRPLTYQGEELEDEPLTPNHLIFGRRLQQMPAAPDDFEEEDVALRRRHIETKLNQIWSRWNKEYLLGLREFHKSKENVKKSGYEVQPGDIVLVENKHAQRGMWKSARVLKLIKGLDGLVRGVAIEVIINGAKRRLERAVQQIFPLEIRAEEKSCEKSKTDEAERPAVRRSQREAAANAKAKISTMAEDEVNPDWSD
eukprot:gene4233-biopygen3409